MEEISYFSSISSKVGKNLLCCRIPLLGEQRKQMVRKRFSNTRSSETFFFKQRLAFLQVLLQDLESQANRNMGVMGNRSISKCMILKWRTVSVLC